MKSNHISTHFLIFALGIAGWTAPVLLNANPGASSSQPAKAGNKSAVPATDNQRFSGKVVETMNAAGYTYILVDTGKQKQWAAAPQFQVKVGDAITIEEAMPMRNYHSKTLKRDFDLVYFTGRALVQGAQANVASSATLPQGHPPITGKTAATAKMNLSGIKKAEGGKTIQEIYANKAQLAGKQVKVRGKVVKYNPMILGKNWIHLQDGSGTEGGNDLTLTTLSEAKVGSIVVATGTIVLDKDFGHGYKYSVILDDAKLAAEPAAAQK